MIVEFHMEAAFLRRTAKALPDATIRVQRLQGKSDGSRALAWIGPAERPPVETCLAEEESITDSNYVSSEGDGHWYVLHTDDDAFTAVESALLAGDGFLLEATRGGDDWSVQARFPERSDVLTFRDGMVTDGVDIEVRTITDDVESTPQFGVTDPQREVLLLALEHGYFTVPREASLSDLAAEMDISSQAASERLRRGTRTLVQNTLAAPERPLVGTEPD